MAANSVWTADATVFYKAQSFTDGYLCNLNADAVAVCQSADDARNSTQWNIMLNEWSNGSYIRVRPYGLLDPPYCLDLRPCVLGDTSCYGPFLGPCLQNATTSGWQLNFNDDGTKFIWNNGLPVANNASLRLFYEDNGFLNMSDVSTLSGTPWQNTHWNITPFAQIDDQRWTIPPAALVASPTPTSEPFTATTGIFATPTGVTVTSNSMQSPTSVMPSQTSATGSPTSTAANIATPSGDGGSGTPVGAIVGGVIGGIAALALLIVAFLLYRRYSKRNTPDHEASVVGAATPMRDTRSANPFDGYSDAGDSVGGKPNGFYGSPGTAGAHTAPVSELDAASPPARLYEADSTPRTAATHGPHELA